MVSIYNIYKNKWDVRRESEGVLRAQHVYCKSIEMNVARVKDSQPFLKTQITITEIFKYGVHFRAMKYGDAINIAFSLETPETWLISSGTGK